MEDKKVVITWVSLSNGSRVSSPVVLFPWNDSDHGLCEKVYSDTNLYSGEFWEKLEKWLPQDRSHTALSIGDSVSIDGKVYVCDDFGFTAK